MSSITQYFAGSEFWLNNSEMAHHQLRSSHVSLEIAKYTGSYTELVFDDAGALIARYWHYNKNSHNDAKEAEWTKHEYPPGDHTYQPHELIQPFALIPDDSGEHYLGGVAPDSFSVPKPSSGFPFQYLGFLNSQDPALNLPKDLHLVLPRLFDFTAPLWIDYSDANSPVLVNDEDIPLHANVADVENATEFTFGRIAFKAKKWPVKSENKLGQAGLPNWVQGPDFKINPKTDQPMDFICVLEEIPEFDGAIYIFFCKDTNLACYLYQGT